MGEVSIHNGEILVDGVPQRVPDQDIAKPSAKPNREDDLAPDEIARQMAQVISKGIFDRATPMEIVNQLLVLKTPGGQKLVWTKWDVRQAFVLWGKKLAGELRV